MIRLTVEREKRGLSRAELARRAKMGAGDVGKIENGRMVPYEKQLKKLGRAMRMRVAESLTLGDEVVTEESAMRDLNLATECLDAMHAGVASGLLVPVPGEPGELELRASMLGEPEPEPEPEPVTPKQPPPGVPREPQPQPDAPATRRMVSVRDDAGDFEPVTGVTERASLA